MRKRFVAALVSAVWLATAGAAHALSLADVNAGAMLVSGDGNLTISFDPGSVTLLGDLDADLSLYQLDATLDGFEVSGPFGVFGAAGFATLLLDYSISGATDLTAAALSMNGVALGATAFGAVTATLSNGAGLGTVVSGAGGGSFADAAAFAAQAALSGTTALQLFAAGPGELASIPTFRQSFDVVSVAEPGSLLMLGFGLLGLAAMGTRTPRRARRSRVGSRPEAV